MERERPCLGERGFCFYAVRLAGLRPLRQVSSLRDSRCWEAYPGLTPWAFLFRRFCGWGILEVAVLGVDGAVGILDRSGLDCVAGVLNRHRGVSDADAR